MSKELLMVGSMPLDTASEVLETFGKPLGKFLRTIPDGEIGPRRYWVSHVHLQVFALHPDLEILLTELGRQRLTNVFVEGGGQVLGAFFARNLIDEVHAFIAPKLIGGADAASPLMGEGRTDMREALSLEDATVKSLDGDVYLHGWTARA